VPDANLSMTSQVLDTHVEMWRVDRLIPYARNPRRNDAAVDRMAASIREFGFKVPVLARSDGEVVDGHLRLKAAKKLGIAEVPVRPLTKAEFSQKLDEWYEKEYQKKYPHSHAKGKPMLVHVDPRDKIKGQDQAWKAYRSFSVPIREYRNKVVHDVQIGTVRVGNINLMPKIEKIKEYSSFATIQDAVRNPETIKRDFVVREEQMFSDFRAFKECINALWQKPIEDLVLLLYEERNTVLLEKYNLQLA
jgi:hypothetical protein